MDKIRVYLSFLFRLSLQVLQVDELIHQTVFGLRMLAIGVITILLSIAMIYIFKFRG